MASKEENVFKKIGEALGEPSEIADSGDLLYVKLIEGHYIDFLGLAKCCVNYHKKLNNEEINEKEDSELQRKHYYPFVDIAKLVITGDFIHEGELQDGCSQSFLAEYYGFRNNDDERIIKLDIVNCPYGLVKLYSNKDFRISMNKVRVELPCDLIASYTVYQKKDTTILLENLIKHDKITF